jgi:hypothetical protein
MDPPPLNVAPVPIENILAELDNLKFITVLTVRVELSPRVRIVELFKNTGCKYVGMGLECGDEKFRKT